MCKMKTTSIGATKKPKFKQYMRISQENTHTTIEGYIGNPAYEITGLTFENDNQTEPVTITNEANGQEFRFNIDLEEFRELLSIEKGIYLLFLNVKIHQDNLAEKKVIKLKTKPTTKIDEVSGYIEYPIRLGCFHDTETFKMNPVNVDGEMLTLYKTMKGNISLALNQTVKQKFETHIERMKTKKDLISFSGKLFTRNFEVDAIQLMVVGREDNRDTYFPLDIEHLQAETIKRFGLNRYVYTASIPLQKLFEGVEKDSNIYDVYFKVHFRNQEEPSFIKVGKPRFKARLKTKSSYTGIGEKIFAVSPYYSHRNHMLCLQVEDFERANYMYMRKLIRWSFLLRPFYKKGNIWLIGELPYKGQDTGYHFFKYIRTNHPEKNAYYIINQNSPDLENVEPYGNVLYFKSKKHIKATIFANKVIMSHHADYLYPLRTKDFKRKLRASIVFLQHGILGAKNMTAFYGSKSEKFDADLMVVSSEREKKIATDDFGYANHEVAVTGLSRFDSLFKDDIPMKRQVLVIPTWREWLTREDLFLNSEYLERYRELIFHPKLKELSETYDFEIVFCLHPNMQKFTHLFKDMPYRIISQGDVNVQDLLKESMMMITDYSSVAFDFSFLEKPIVYYQFDRRRFLGKKGSHINLDKELPGDIAFELSDVLKDIEAYGENDFRMTKENKQKASTFLKYKDQNASERIYEAILHADFKKSRLDKLTQSIILKKVYNRFRKSKRYIPFMTLMYKVAKKILPIDNRLIVFESGVGKQFTDSPRNLYEEIVRRKLSYKKVWVYNKTVQFVDPKNTIQIKRLSPKYFYYLARAGIWINNQNFPTYITKRKGTTYIQTWHGTPLKKMLYDIENVMGRNDTYLDRVSNSVNQWDYLLSPSPYATKSFRSAFQYKGDVIETGYPRNDLFYKEDRSEIAADLKKRLNLPNDKKVILYAPTFRDNQTSKSNKFMFKIQMDLERMQEELGDDYIILLRMHVVIKNKITIPAAQKEFVMNVSGYPDAQELLLISDILITDYSSLMFDFANTKRPMIYYTYDLEAYRDIVRGFYIDFEQDAPGPFVFTTEEIIDAIKKIDTISEQYKEKYDIFYEKYCMLEDGQATNRVIDYLTDEQVLR